MALEAIGDAVDSSASKPINGHCCLSAGLIASDNGELRIEVELDDQRDGSLANSMLILPHDRLKRIMQSVDPNAHIQLVDGDNGAACITSGRDSWTLPTMPASDWPAVEDPKLKNVCRLPADQFYRMASHARVACETGHHCRTALSVVMFEWADGVLTLVGTDSRNWCVASSQIDQATDDSQTLVPRKSIDAMVNAARRAGDASGVQLERSDTQAVARFERTTITARQLGGHFPMWREIGQERAEQPTKVSVGALLALCNAASICTSPTSKGVAMTTGKTVRMKATSSEHGKAVCECDCALAGASVTAIIDLSTAAKWLGTIEEAATVEMHLTNSESAIVLVCEDTYTVIMPLVA